MSLFVIDAGATDNYVAQTDETHQYTTLTAAIEGATSGQTVTLLANTDVSAAGLTISKTVTLDLNGYTVKAANTNPGQILVTGSLTLKDSSEAATGRIYTETDYAGAASGFGLIEVNGGSFTMDSGYIYAVRDNASNKGQYAVTATGDNASVTINGGTIEAGWYAIAGNGARTTNSIITVNGGSLISTADYAVYHPIAGGTLTVAGGTISGLAGGIAMNNGNLVVTGGTIESKGTGDTGDWGDGTGNLSNSAISLNARYGAVSASIANATVSASGNAIAVATNPANTITLSSVTNTTICVSSASAFNSALLTAAKGEGNTIKLIGNIDISAAGATVASSVTLDLNGYTVKAANTNPGQILVTGSLTLKDSSEAATGKIYTETDYAGAASGFGLVEVNGGSFTMDSGYIYAVRDNASDKGQFAVTATGDNASITINGGTIEAGWYAIAGNGGKTTNSSITVNGGSLISTADYAVYHPVAGGTLTVTGGHISGLAGGIAMNNGNLVVTGGIIDSKGTGDTGSWSDGTGGLGNSAIILNGKYGAVSASITNATLYAAGNAVAVTANPSYATSLSAVTNTTIYVSTVGAFNSALLTAAKGEGNTIKLNGNITSPSTAIYYDITSSVTIDLNGHELSGLADGGRTTAAGNAAPTSFIIVEKGATLTVSDSSTGKTGVISSTYKASSPLQVIDIQDGGKLVLNSGTITNGSDVTYGSTCVCVRAGIFEMNGGSVTAVKNPSVAKRAYPVFNNTANATISISGGTLSSGSGDKVSASSQSLLRISGGTFENSTFPGINYLDSGCVAAWSGTTCTVSKTVPSSFVASITRGDKTECYETAAKAVGNLTSGDKLTIGAADTEVTLSVPRTSTYTLSFSGSGTLASTSAITLTGKLIVNGTVPSGTITAAAGYTLVTSTEGSTTTYTTTVTDENAAARLIRADGTYANYLVLKDAVSDALAGDTIVLMQNVDLGSSSLTIAKEITLDLNGHAITSACASASFGVIALFTNNISIVDTSAAKTGKISNTSSGYGITVSGSEKTYSISGITVTAVSKAAVYIKAGTVNIDSGTYNGVCGISVDSGAAANIYGGYFSGSTASVLAGTSGTITVFGGYYTSDISSFLSTSRHADTGSWTANEVTYTYKVDNASCRIGETTYASIADAVAASSSGDTIVLTNNVFEDVVIPSGKTLSLDLNGYTLTGVAVDDKKACMDAVGETAVDPFIQATITNEGALTILDSSTAKTGTVKANGVYNGALFNKAGGTAVLSGGTFTDFSASGGCWYIVVNLGNMTINSGTVIANQNPEKTSDTALINGCDQQLFPGNALNGYTTTTDAVMVINGGTVTSGLFAVKNGDWFASMTINSGTFTSKNNSNVGVVLSNANNSPLTVNGGKFVATGDSTPVIKCKNKSAYIGNAPRGGTGLKILGGTFISGGGDVLQTLNKDSIPAAIVYVYDGAFSGTINAKTEASNSGSTYKVDPSGTVIVGGLYTYSDVGKFTAAGYTASYCTTEQDGITYHYNVAPVAVLKIASATAAVVNGDGTASDQEATAAVNGTTISVSGMIGSDKTIVVTYTETDGQTGTFSIAYDSSLGFIVSQKSVTVGSTTYYINISGLSLVPAEVKLATAAPAASADTEGKSEEQAAAMNAAAAALNGSSDVSASGITSAASDVISTDKSGGVSVQALNENGTTTTVNTSTATQALADKSIVTEDKDVRIVVETYLDINVTNYTMTDGVAALELQITPMYNIKATVAADGETMSSENTVTIGQPQKLETTQPITLTIPVTEAIANSLDSGSIFVKHEKDDGTVYYYKGVIENGVLTFTDTNGFSKFTVTSDTRIGTVRYADMGDVTYTAADIGTALPTAYSSGKTFQGWTIDGKTYTGTITEALLTAINGSAFDATPVFSAWNNPFKDVKTTDWFYSHVEYAKTHNLFNGLSEDSFGPNDTMTRGMLVMVLYSLAGRPEISAVNTFKDVKSTDWYYNAVRWASDNGIASGYGGGLFGPNDNVTREQVVTILIHYANYSHSDTSNTDKALANTYSDYAGTSSYAQDAMAWALNEGLLHGDEAHHLNPQGNATRAEVATILEFYCENVINGAD